MSFAAMLLRDRYNCESHGLVVKGGVGVSRKMSIKPELWPLATFCVSLLQAVVILFS